MTELPEIKRSRLQPFWNWWSRRGGPARLGLATLWMAFWCGLVWVVTLPLNSWQTELLAIAIAGLGMSWAGDQLRKLGKERAAYERAQRDFMSAYQALLDRQRDSDQ